MKTLKIKKLAAAIGAVLAFSSAQNANAVVVDDVFFYAAPVVIVWGAPAYGGAGPVVNDFWMLSSSTSGDPGVDLIADTTYAVVTGGLTGITQRGSETISDSAIYALGSSSHDDTPASNGYLDDADTYTAFNLLGTSDITFGSSTQHSFFAASNTGFAIEAILNGTTGDVSAIKYWLELSTGPGPAAELSYGGVGLNQYPNSGGALAGVAYPNFVGATPLTTFNASTQVYLGNQKTALAPGTIAQHSVRFTNNYSLDYDLSQGSGAISATVEFRFYTP